MNIRRLLHTEFGVNIISVLLGLGLAGLFRRVCNDRDCIIFNGPDIDDIKEQVFRHNDKCYRFDEHSESCDNAEKKIINCA